MQSGKNRKDIRRKVPTKVYNDYDSVLSHIRCFCGQNQGVFGGRWM